MSDLQNLNPLGKENNKMKIVLKKVSYFKKG